MPRRFRCLWLAAALLSFLATGCERPFVERAPATFEVMQPQRLDRTFLRPDLPLQVRVSAQREVQRVEVNGEDMAFSEERGTWADTLRLKVGVNALQMTAYGPEGVSGRDTLYAAYLSYTLNVIPNALPAPRGGHTATLLQSGDVLVTGGAPRLGANASREAFLLAANQRRAQRLDAPLAAPRSGHTATLLPDGRVLLMGGSRVEDPASRSDLVQTAEVYDPADQTFHRLPVRGPAVHRTRHVAVLLESTPRVIVGIIGGRGIIGSTLGLRRDLRRFELRRDTLVALDPSHGLLLGERIAGHTLTPLGNSQYLIAGSLFSGSGARDVTFRLERSKTDHYRVRRAPPFRIPRTRHTAAPLAENDVLFFGGTRGDPGLALRAIELHAPRAERTFQVFASRPPPVFAASVTKPAPDRILLLGGFSTDGEGRSYAAFFDIRK